MKRQIVYSGAIPQDSDVLNTNRNTMVAIAKVAAAMLGTSTIVNGLACSPTSPASMQVQVAPGEIYSLANLDGTAYGSLAADTTHQILKQGILLDAATLSCPAPTTNGFSVNYLIEATYQDVDSNALVLPYYNASNPSQAFSGAGNNGAAQNTTRDGVCTLQVKAGIAATTGTQVTPSADSGYVGLWVVTVAYGQTTITSANITQAVNAPFLPAGGLVPAIQGSALTFAPDTGAANIYKAQYNPPITTLSDGLILSFKAKNANSGSSTFSPNGLSASSIYGGGHVALQGGEIVANGLVEVEWNSSLNGWVLLTCTGGSVQVPNGVQSQQAVAIGQLFGSLRGFQQFSSNGSFTVPAGVTRIYVSLVGGGGGGAGALSGVNYTPGGGGSGGVIFKSPLTVTSGQVIAVTLGAGGGGGVGSANGGTYANSNGAAGGASTFGVLLSVSGGAGGRCQPGDSNGGSPGTTQFAGYGGNGSDSPSTRPDGGAGGSNIFSAPTFTGHGPQPAVGYGAGGGGGRASGYLTNGGTGANGFCLVEW